ncbi:hypothetical protein BGX28_010160 [Mortierella sp. GBA30]|nr:hypothetical protein BGX28_010160 [Mortierella sp. GBA30]
MEKSSLISNATSEIEAEFQDLMGPISSAAELEGSSAQALQDSVDDNQDWEWVEETEYIILDFGGANYNYKDMEQLTAGGYSLVGLDTPSPYFSAQGHVFKGFYDENAITEDLLFNMKVHDNIKEGLDDNDDENTDELDLIGVVTKRIIFEQVELMPMSRTEPESEPESTIANTVPQPKPSKYKTLSVHKAARESLGVKSSYAPKKHRVDKGKGKAKETYDQIMDLDP